MSRQALETYLRNEAAPAGAHLLLRGSPLTADAFVRSSERAARAYTFGGSPCLGISVELSSGSVETDQLLRGRRLSTRHHVARIRVADAVAAGFVMLPTFSAPHYTVLVGRTPGATVGALVELALRDVLANPYYEPRRESRHERRDRL